ncbi:NADP-dependent malic enzyme [Methylobacterium haplocladii]|uniref:Malic enzyme n=1 Tax=Methylobacterium haplocladii TaxID=1176176 RepID=A0A512ISL0_9HYPH|nr:NADP-dependent malic enzyme [Methylobacterium haplocladii]GEP00673.1 malic enzyme [Methylobacterium haplocladii]GJD82453.1 NADP-dependent malic enzyme [Methylobacterium haplocladii]GLS60489.1 malic enzyme [Methylobacterium haplocladii]
MDEQLEKAALDYHRLPKPGKISVLPTKAMATQRDLALAYSPGVAAACLLIKNDPLQAAEMTSRSNLVGVITNGTAVLGLGNIGALAGKPVMEGKGCLFQKFAGIDVFDIEIDETDPDKLIEIIASLEPTFGGINLEDIKAPECFEIEARLRERMKIPVFHDDQHGTAIIVAAAILNGLKVAGKRIEDVELVCSGAGSAAIACLNLLVFLGLPREHITVSDIEGVVYRGRTSLMDPQKAQYARETSARTLGEVIAGADIFLGVSAANVLTQDMVRGMADRPLILALANPDPEISPDLARAVRPDAIIATGRSDYPNQVNNVLCFPFIFRGALDVGATAINEEMKLAAVRAIAELAQAEQSDVVTAAYGTQEVSFGPDYLIPRPFDPRLITKIAPAVALAAMASGVATRPIADIDAYRRSLERVVYTSGTVMQPVFAAAAEAALRRIAFSEGENDRVLRAAQVIVDERLARPVLIGRPDTIAHKMRDLGLRIEVGRDVEVVDVGDERFQAEAAEGYYTLRKRDGLSREMARAEARRNPTLAGTMLLRFGRVDGLLCGGFGSYHSHLRHVREVIGHGPGVDALAAMSLLQLPQHTLFICDPYIHLDPTAAEIAGMTLLAADEMRRFGQTPRVALVSHSSFGTAKNASAAKMRHALDLILQRAPDLEVDGEMQADAALSHSLLDGVFPESRLKGEANLLVMPNLDAANITLNALKVVAGHGISVGPMLLGSAQPVHILSHTTTVRGIVNMTALTATTAASRLKPAAG